jgi:hypothetical protein
MPDDEALRRFVQRVGAFHVTDRAMRSAQSAIQAVLANGSAGERDVASYAQAVRRYFAGFEREAHAQLRDVDKRLENVNQVHFNLTAERGVVVKRIEATQSVLNDLGTLEQVR